jgi:queuine tRNA-ribosyltransferase
VTKSLDSQDLLEAHVEGVVVNSYHLASEPGLATLGRFNGVKGFMNFPGLVVSDSGGWQVFSLIYRNNIPGDITDAGVVFTVGSAQKKQMFTPEDSIRVQFGINSDIVVCLDDFTPPNASQEKIRESVERTILWASRCKAAFLRLVAEKGYSEQTRPLLMAVIHGGWRRELRKFCAEELVKIGFDAFGFGGYLIDDSTGKLDLELLKFIADLIPHDKIKFALGVGSPADIVQCFHMGWQIFDCTLPTRDARHKRLYVFTGSPIRINDVHYADFYKYVYINRNVFKNDEIPVDPTCDCALCKNYSKAYLHHLFKINDTLAFRLATIHNLRFYTRLIECLRQ